ncbi:MAG: hypothetical protein WCH96_02495 [Betaproteobacteria bacterium]
MKKQLCVTLAATAVLNGIVSRFFMGELTVNPSFYEKMPFDTEKDLVAITPLHHYTITPLHHYTIHTICHAFCSLSSPPLHTLLARISSLVSFKE